MKSILTIKEYKYICMFIKRYHHTIKDIKYIKKEVDSSGLIAHLIIRFNDRWCILISLNICGPYKDCCDFSRMEEDKCYSLDELNLTEIMTSNELTKEEYESLKEALDALYNTHKENTERIFWGHLKQ